MGACRLGTCSGACPFFLVLLEGDLVAVFPHLAGVMNFERRVFLVSVRHCYEVDSGLGRDSVNSCFVVNKNILLFGSIGES